MKDKSIDLTSFATEQDMLTEVRSIESFYKIARDAFDQKRYRVSIIYLKKILQIDNTYLPAFKMLARIFQIRRQYQRAESILRQAIVINFRDAELHYMLGYIYYLDKKKELFARECTKALVVNPRFSKAFYALALLHYENGRYEKAEVELDKCLKINDNDIEAQFLRVNICIKRRDFKQAKKILVEIIKLNNNDRNAHYALGEIAYILKEYDLSLNHFLLSQRDDKKIKYKINKVFFLLKVKIDERLNKDPGDIDAVMDLASLHYEIGHYSEAKKILSGLIRKYPKYLPGVINFGLMLIYENKFMEGITIYKKVLKLSPSNKQALKNVEIAYELAEEYYLRNKNKTNLRLLLDIYMDQRKYDRVLLLMIDLKTKKYAKEILKETSSKKDLENMIFQGGAFYVLGEYQEAEYLLKALARKEEDKLKNKKVPPLYYFLGLLAQQGLHLTEAFKYFDKVKNIDSQYWNVERELTGIRIEEISRIEKELKKSDKAGLRLQYVDLLILTHSYKKGLIYLIGLRKKNALSTQLEEKMHRLIELYERDLELQLEDDKPKVSVYLELGEIYVYKKQYNDAFSLLQQAVKIYPDNAKVKDFFWHLVDKNMEVYEEMLKTEPTTMVYYNLAVLYALKNKKNEFIEMLSKAVNKDKSLAIQARYEDAFKKYRNLEKFRAAIYIEGDDSHIYEMLQD